MNYKIVIFTGLMALSAHNTLLPNDQINQNELCKQENSEQIDNNKNNNDCIALLKAEIEQLEKEKADLLGTYHVMVKPAGYITASLPLGAFTALCTIGNIIDCNKFGLWNYTKNIIKDFTFQSPDKCKDFCATNIFTTLPIITGIIAKKLLTKAWNHKQTTAQRIEEIDATIQLKKEKIAQLQQQE